MYFACHSVIDVHGEDAVLPTLGHGEDVDVTGPDYTPEEGFTWNGMELYVLILCGLYRMCSI